MTDANTPLMYEIDQFAFEKDNPTSHNIETESHPKHEELFSRIEFFP